MTESGAEAVANVVMVAHGREDLSWLLAEVERLQSSLDQVVDWGPSDAGRIVFEELERATHQIHALRQALEPFAGAGDDPHPYDLADRDDWYNAAKVYEETTP